MKKNKDKHEVREQQIRERSRMNGTKVIFSTYAMCETMIDNNKKHRQGPQNLKITFPFHVII